MCLTPLQYPPYAPVEHCSGCRCFEPPMTTTTPLFLRPEYQPKHRKPGPAR